MTLFKIQPKGHSFDDMPFYFQVSRSILSSLISDFGDYLSSESGVSTMAVLDDSRVGLYFDTEEEMNAMKMALLKTRLFQLRETFIW